MALGMAVSMAGGVEANFGTMTKPLHVGHAARNAVVAAKLAAAGFTANEEAIESGVGYYDAYFQVFPDDNSPLNDLGTSWELVNSGLRIKPSPCGGLAHTSIDAALALRADGLTFEDIEAIEVEVTERVLERIVFKVPQNELQAKFSMPYLISRALVDGHVGVSAFTDEAIGDQRILSIAEMVVMHLGVDLESTKEGRPSRVTVRYRNGRTVSRRVDAPKGGEVFPMTIDELHAKFNECASRTMDSTSADSLTKIIGELENVRDLVALRRLLRG